MEHRNLRLKRVSFYVLLYREIEAVREEGELNLIDSATNLPFAKDRCFQAALLLSVDVEYGSKEQKLCACAPVCNIHSKHLSLMHLSLGKRILYVCDLIDCVLISPSLMVKNTDYSKECISKIERNMTLIA